MRIRQAIVATMAALAGFILISPSAQAAPAADPVSCTITGVSPNTIVLGIAAESVQFNVATNCDRQHPVSWLIQAENYRGSAHVSWLAVCNYDRPPDPSVVDCAHHGATTMSMIGVGDWKGNAMAGTTHPLFVYAFYDANGDHSADDGETTDHYTGSFTLLRQTTFGSSFQVAARSHGQKLNLTGQISRANWDVGCFDEFATAVTVQFRRAGTRHYVNVKQIWDDGGGASTIVKATRSGSWRYHFAGNATDAPANSASRYVRVHH